MMMEKEKEKEERFVEPYFNRLPSTVLVQCD